MSIPTNWLENSDYPKCIVAIFDYYTTEVQTMYLSTHKKTATYLGTETCFNPRLYGDIIFKTGLTDSDKGLRTTSSIGNLKIINADGKLDNWLDIGLDGRAIKLIIMPLYSTDIDADGVTIFNGTIDNLEITDNSTLSIIFKDPLILLDLPIQDILYTDAEVINYTILGVPKTVTIASDLKDKPKPIVYGKVYNIEPVLLSATNKVYQVDHLEIENVIGVYDRGIALTPVTGYNLDLTKGIIELVNNTSGTITCDVLGRKVNAGVYSDSVSDIVKTILIDKSVSLLNINMDNAINTPVGIYISERENTLDILDKLVSSFDGFYGFDSFGVFRLGCLTIPNTSQPLHILCEKGSKYGDVITDGTNEYLLASNLGPSPDYTSIATLSNSGLITRFNQPYIIEESDILGDITIKSTNNINYRVKVKHTKNFTVQTDIASSIGAARKEFISKEFREVALDNLPIKTKHVRAIEKEPYDTLLTTETYASFIANRFIEKNSRYVFEISLKIVASKLVDATIGSIIKLIDYRYGLDTGVLCTVRDISINYLYGYAEVLAIFSRVPNQNGTFNYGLTNTTVPVSTTETIPAIHKYGRRYFSVDKDIGITPTCYTEITIESIIPDIADPVITISKVMAGELNISVNGGTVFTVSDLYDVVILVDFDAGRVAIYSDSIYYNSYILPTGFKQIKVENTDTVFDTLVKFDVAAIPVVDCLPWGILETKKQYNYEV